MESLNTLVMTNCNLGQVVVPCLYPGSLDLVLALGYTLSMYSLLQVFGATSNTRIASSTTSEVSKIVAEKSVAK